MRRLRKVIAVVAVLATAENAFADNILRRGGAPNAATAPADAAQSAAAVAAAQANAAAQYAQGPMRQALDAIKVFQAAQAAARAAAQAAASGVPNGLVDGGLVIANGAGQDPGLWQGAALPGQTSKDGKTTVTVVQKDDKAILTWKTFNVGKDTDLVFDQKTFGGDAAGSWIVLNRVLDPGAAPSKILGSIHADGQVYVLNRNGILFGGTSQVNVGTLVVSSLEIFGGDQRFRAGLLSQGGTTFGGDGVPGGAVVVEAGARLSIGNYGQALLLGGRVENHGTIEAPDGQVILAAGTGISLAGSTTPNLRGYAVVAPTGGGTVENTGIVSTPRGNATLVADSVTQGGLVTATTSGEASGSIRIGQDGGTTTFEAGSVTQVLPDDDGKKVVGATLQDFQRSEVLVSGERISLLGDARIYAPSGDVSLSAKVSPTQTEAVDGTRIYVDSGASIDVSGLRDVELPMESNAIEAQLRANELRDNPLLRDSTGIRGRTVWFDPRLGVAVADVSGYSALVPRDVKEFMTRGGSVTLAANEIITRQGSTIDLSGGSYRFLDGYVRSSILVDAAGNPVRIEDAKLGVKYVGLLGDFVVDHARWGVTETFAASLARNRPRFEAGYVQGSAAGSLNVTTNGLTAPPPSGDPHPPIDPHPTGEYRIFDGAVVATTVVGPKQRDIPTGTADPVRSWREVPAGATLNVDRAGDVTIQDGGSQLPAGFASGDALDASKRYEHVLPAQWFDGHTFSNVSIRAGYTDDRVEFNNAVVAVGTRNLAPGGNLSIGKGVVVDLGDGGAFSFTGKRADIDGTIRAAGGSVAITALDLPSPPDVDAGIRSTIRLGGEGMIDVGGRWSNDHLDGTGVPLRALDGGSVRLRGRDVLLEKGSRVDVSGGGRLNAAGTKVTAG
ncbi:MAG: filamentous hemagglutinin N-terminal domain-containing protein, partial [Deltaproteobacteria bacterium]